MENTSLIQLYQILPQNLKQEVLDFVYFLLAKYDIQVPTKPEEPAKRPSYFGNAKGDVIITITLMSLWHTTFERK